MRTILLEETGALTTLRGHTAEVWAAKFFARLNGVPGGDAQAFITAWRAYRGCLDREQ